MPARRHPQHPLQDPPPHGEIAHPSTTQNHLEPPGGGSWSPDTSQLLKTLPWIKPVVQRQKGCAVGDDMVIGHGTVHEVYKYNSVV